MTAVPTVLSGQPLSIVDVEGNGQRSPQIVEIAVLALPDHDTSTADPATGDALAGVEYDDIRS